MAPDEADRRIVVVVALIVGVSTLFQITNVKADPDLWWHTRVGLELLGNGSLHTHDVYSYTAEGAPWTNHEWLADACFGVAFALFEDRGLLSLRMLLLIGVAIAFARLLLARFRHAFAVSLAYVLAVPFIALFINVRPHSFTYLFALVFLLCFDAYRDGRRRWIWMLPILMIFWVNLHGGFLLGIGIAGLGIGSTLVGGESGALNLRNLKEHRVLFLVGLATVLAPLVNPYGPGLLVYLLRELGADHSIISEWKHPSALQWLLLIPWIAAPIFALVLAKRVGRLTTFALFPLSIVGTYIHGRFAILLVLFSTLVLFEALDDIAARLPAKTRLTPLTSRLSSPIAAAVLVAFVFASFGVEFAQDLSRKGLHLEVPRQQYPVRAVKYLKAKELGPKLAPAFNWGGYAIWHLSPSYKVAVDGRNLMIYTDTFVDGYLRSYKRGGFARVLSTNPPDVVLIHSNGPAHDELRRDDGWLEIYRDAIASVFVPPNVAHERGLKTPSATASGTPGSDEITIFP